MSNTDLTSEGARRVYREYLLFQDLAAAATDPRVKNIYTRTYLALYSVLIGGPWDAESLLELLKSDERMKSGE